MKGLIVNQLNLTTLTIDHTNQIVWVSIFWRAKLTTSLQHWNHNRQFNSALMRSPEPQTTV